MRIGLLVSCLLGLAIGFQGFGCSPSHSTQPVCDFGPASSCGEAPEDAGDVPVEAGDASASPRCSVGSGSCASLGSESTCTGVGCTWSSTTGSCLLPVSDCSSLDASECITIAGCTLVDQGAPPPGPPGALFPLAPDENAVGIVADGTNVYALLAVPVGSCAARWVRVPRDGSSAPVTIWSGAACGPFAVADASDQLFWAQTSGSTTQFLALPKNAGADAGAATTVATVGNPPCGTGQVCGGTSIAADATGYYWANFGTYTSYGQNGYSCSGSSVSGALRGASPSVLASDEQCAETLGEANGSLYWLAEGNSQGTAYATRTIATLGGDAGAASPTTIATAPGGTYPVSISQGSLYILSGSQLTSTSLGPGAQLGTPVVVASGLTGTIPLVVAGAPTETAWIDDNTDGSFSAVYASVSTMTATTASGGAQGAGIAIDQGKVYFASQGYLVGLSY